MLNYFLNLFSKPQDVANSPTPEIQPNVLSTEQDCPVDFGYKMAWLAVSDRTIDLQHVLKGVEAQPANWSTGIDFIYQYKNIDFVFADISPEI